ncbi:hypothetical protein EDB83DRAFT_2322267 [Lactarius deliciosus]|nr:hypothetical protein EDB83DRAFT_2322267 [Lactarius deliciosus]
MGSAWGHMMCKNLTFSTISWMANLEIRANSRDLKMAAMSSAPCHGQLSAACDSELPAAAVLVHIAIVIVVVADSSEGLKTLTYLGYIGGVPLDVVAVFELQSSPICCGPALVVISVVAALCCGSPEETRQMRVRLGHIDVTAAAEKDQRGLVKNDKRQFPPVP